jgi:hypothetical protein
MSAEPSSLGAVQVNPDWASPQPARTGPRTRPPLWDHTAEPVPDWASVPSARARVRLRPAPERVAQRTFAAVLAESLPQARRPRFASPVQNRDTHAAVIALHHSWRPHARLLFHPRRPFKHPALSPAEAWDTVEIHVRYPSLGRQLRARPKRPSHSRRSCPHGAARSHPGSSSVGAASRTAFGHHCHRQRPKQLRGRTPEYKARDPRSRVTENHLDPTVGDGKTRLPSQTTRTDYSSSVAASA